MKYILPFLVIVFPVVAFCVASFGELRSHERKLHAILNLSPAIAGIIAYALGWAFPVLHVAMPDGRVTAMFFALVACSGAFIKYSRRSTSILIALGGLELVFISIFFSDVLR